MQNNLCPQCQSPIPADAPGGICPGCALLGVALPTSPTQVAGASVPMLDEVAAAFPELEVLELYGQGGMGAVFKARQPKLDRFVALKILTPALATQPGFAERFTREARALAKLSHPNIVGVHDFGESGGFFYLLMEFVDGVNLRQAMRAGVTPEQALLLVPKVCEALQFAHDHGVLHRDIKPENILLDTHGVPKLADFGIAKFGDDKSTGLTMSGMQLGTAAYMAPEQIEQPATVDHRADIYSLGVVLYEMLTGELPLGRFAAPSEKMHCSSGVDDVVLRALEKQRERRQQSATEMKTQVEGAATRNAAPPPPPAPARRSACYLCTPEHLRSAACNFYIYTAKGHVALDAHTLTFVGDGESVTIPLRAIRELGIGHYPALAKPVRLDFLSIVWEENGALRTRLFTPHLSAFSAAWTTNSVVAEWAEAVRTGARGVQGRDIPFTPSCALGTRVPSWSYLAFAMFIPVLIAAAFLIAFIGGKSESPGHFLLGVLGIAIGAAIVWVFIKALRRDLNIPPLPTPPPPSRDAPFSRAAAVGASVCISSIPFGLILFLFVKAVIDPSLDSRGQLNGPVAGNIVIFGFIPALIGVALGWKAVGDFRYHRGHLRGGGTAVFAALGLPVLALILTALTNFEDIDRAINPFRIGSAGTLVACVVVLTAFAASNWAVRALWRFVHTGPPGVPLPQKAAVDWPRRVFLLIVCIICVPVALLALGLIVPMLARKNPPPPQAEISEPRIRLLFKAQQIPTPGTESLKVVGLAPFGWMMDFSLDLRDSAGTHDSVRELTIPLYDFLAAQRIPSGSQPTRGLEVGAEWQITSTADGTTELHTRYGRAPDFKVNYDPKTGGSPMIPDPGISKGGTIPGLEAYRWTQHPDRQRYSELKLPVEIPFVIGHAPGKPDVQLFIKATARPMKPDEHADEMVIYMDNQRGRFRGLRTDEKRAQQHPKYREASAAFAELKAEIAALEKEAAEYEKTHPATDAAAVQRREKIAAMKQIAVYRDHYSRWIYWAIAAPADNEDLTKETPELQALKFRVADIKAQMEPLKMTVYKGDGPHAIVTRPESTQAMAELKTELAKAEAERDAMIQKLNQPEVEKP